MVAVQTGMRVSEVTSLRSGIDGRFSRYRPKDELLAFLTKL